jgi:hypothetical protein
VMIMVMDYVNRERKEERCLDASEMVDGCIVGYRLSRLEMD